MGMAENTLPPGWKKTTILFTQEVRLGNQLFEYLENALPTCKYAFGVLDRDLDVAPTQSSSVTAFMWNGSSSGSAYQRYRNTSYQSLISWTASYDAIVFEGATFTVLYIE